MPLSTKSISALSTDPSRKTKHFDSGGLYIEVARSGSKLWRLKYRFNGKEKLLSLGKFPLISLKDARVKRDQAKALLAQGIDPGEERREAKQQSNANRATFEAIALEWFEVKQSDKSSSHTKRVLSRLKNHLFPYIGKTPVNEVTPLELLKALRRLEDRGNLESARKVKGIAGQVMRYAIVLGEAERDPSRDLQGALRQPVVKHFAAITDPEAVGYLLRAIDDYRGAVVTEVALKLSPLLFARPGELRSMEWSEVNFMRKRWEIPAAKMKMRDDHIVPLSHQALALLQHIHSITGGGRYVFPGQRSSERPLSENGIRTALRTLGYSNDEMTPHGFRAMARTLLDEELGFRTEFIEQQLAHTVKDSNGTAYNRTKHLRERTQMMQAWADYLDELKLGHQNNYASFE